MRISVLQMNPGPDKQANIAQARRLAEQAMAEDRPDFIGLPEMWSGLGGTPAQKREQAETLPPLGTDVAGGPAYEFLRELARGARIYVHGGSIAERVPTSDKLFNTTVGFDPNGQEIARYRKIHLFDITAPDGTGYRESDTYDAGAEIVTYWAGDLVVGAAICYDLRFPELFLALRQAGATLIWLPSNFTLLTGKDHWEPLIRARAIETQCWIAAPAVCGRWLDGPREEPRHSYGHSMIVDPWGYVVARASDAIGWATTRLDQELTERVRRHMPVLDHRRLV